MSTKTTITLIDDLDGTSEAASTVKFGFNGKRYEIDLTETHRAKLEKLLAPYIDNGRPDSSPFPGTRRTGARRGNQGVREWAAANGIQVGAKGRVPASVQAKYDAAMGRSSSATPAPDFSG